MTRPEDDPSAKFHLRSIGELKHPGVCLACGSATRVEGYVDLATFYDYEGQMYLCAYCTEEAAAVLGCLTEAESDALQAENIRLLTEVQQLKDKLTDVESRLAGINQYIAPLASTLSGLVAPVQDTDDESESNGSDAGTTGSTDSGEPEPKEPVKGSRRNVTARVTSSDTVGISI